MSTLPHSALTATAETTGPSTDIIDRRYDDDTLTADDRRALAGLIHAVQGAEDVARRTQSTIPGEWQHVVGVVAVLP